MTCEDYSHKKWSDYMPWRYFEIHPDWLDAGIAIPQRATCGSAGYDIAAALDVKIPPMSVKLIPTGLRIKLQPGEYLQISLRSGFAHMNPVIIPNAPAIIDSDYYGNERNGGQLIMPIRNLSPVMSIDIAKGQRIAQGIILRYIVTTNDEPRSGERVGGFGSTGTKEDEWEGF